MNAPSALPPALSSALARYAWQRVTIGESHAAVYRLSRAGETDLILKVLERSPLHSLGGEAARLRWLQGRAPVPALADFTSDARRDYLLMSALSGHDAATVALAPALLVDLLADALRQLHAVPIADCPFHYSIDDSLSEARAMLDAGQADLARLEPANHGRTAADLYTELLAARPAVETAVFTHGDFCLPNIMVHDGQLSGFIDVGRAGLSDPCRDLALAARSLGRNLAPAWIERFFMRYGMPVPDPHRLHYFLLLDEFF